MASPVTRPQPLRANLAPAVTKQSQIHALVVSFELEIRKPLLRTLESLKADVVVCSRVEQAEEVLGRDPIDVVFCDEHLPDGSYVNLLEANHGHNKIPRLVVTTRQGDWNLYFEAVAKGAFDVIRCPCQPTDVEMTLIRVLREGDESVGACA